MSEAVGLVRSAPWEIEADLQREYPGRRIREWYHFLLTGDDTVGVGMSSRELIVLVEGFTEGSQFKRRFGSGWTTAELIAARHVNAYIAAHTDEGTSPDVIHPPNRHDGDDVEAYDGPSTDDIESMIDGNYDGYDLAA